ncbi:DUF6221 family protein [Actinomadura sediminis]|uniref:DUF6221 family protein n=1 Tax=Actinomadura sediminis TaxID=1038904 RepID=A0ABW3EPR0_9ACTN
MSDLVEFLRQRLNEDEQAARSAMVALGAENGMPSWPDYQTYDTPEIDTAQDYLTRFQPARVLAEVEAKRRIIEEHAPTPTPGGLSPLYCGTGEAWSHLDGSCVTLRLLAQGYRHRDGWRKEWAT